MHDTQITTLDELRDKILVGFQLEGVELVVLLNNGVVSVFEGRCPHQGTLLSEGQIERNVLTCRGHGWQFNCLNGVNVEDPQIRLHQFSAIIDGDAVLVEREEVRSWAGEQNKLERQKPEKEMVTPEMLPGPPGLPVLGNLHQLKVDKIHLILEEWYRQYGDIYQIKLGPQPAVVIADPDIIQQILQERPDGFSRLSDIRRTIEEMGVVGLFSAEGEQWRRHRQLATRTFDVRHLREFFPTMTRITRRFYQRWQELATRNEPVDIQKELMRYTVDITTNLAFGYDLNTLQEEGDRLQQQLELIFPKVAYRTFMPLRYWNYLNLPSDRALESALVELKDAVNHFIEHARQQMASNPHLKERPQNLLQALLAAQADEDIEFSDLEIYGNVFTFLLAGEDTTANSMAWMMYFMTEYPEVQRQMQAEADAVLLDQVMVTEYDRIRDLTFIEAVAHETMRLKPVAAFLGLQALQNVNVNSLQIPEGTPVFVLLRPKGLTDSEFEAAVDFKPERWLNYTRLENPHHRKSFLPFGGGPRLCPGRSLSLLEIKMALSMICRHFDVFRAEPDRSIEERFVFTVAPEELMVTVHPR